MAAWTIHLDSGPKRVNHAAVCVNGMIYSFGGYCTGENYAVRRDIDIHRYDIGECKNVNCPVTDLLREF